MIAIFPQNFPQCLWGCLNPKRTPNLSCGKNSLEIKTIFKNQFDFCADQSIFVQIKMFFVQKLAIIVQDFNFVKSPQSVEFI